MSEHEDSARTVAVPRTLQAIAKQVAGDFIHRLAPAFRPPARLVCPSDEAEQDTVDAVTQAAIARGIPVEVIDVRPEPADRGSRHGAVAAGSAELSIKSDIRRGAPP